MLSTAAAGNSWAQGMPRRRTLRGRQPPHGHGLYRRPEVRFVPAAVASTQSSQAASASPLRRLSEVGMAGLWARQSITSLVSRATESEAQEIVAHDGVPL